LNLVSTIVPVFNRPALLRQAVQSVLNQDYRPIEVVIVDDGSTDSTPEVIQELQAQFPHLVYPIRQMNSGPGAAREAGRLAARGEFIQYLDSDDLLLPGKFSAQVRALRDDTEAGISYGIVLDEDAQTGKRTVTHGTDVAHRTIFPAVLKNRLWHTISPLYRSSVCQAIGPWSTQQILEDWDYDCRAGLLGVKLHHCAEEVAVARDGGDVHAGFAWQDDPDAMLDRVRGYIQVLDHAHKAGVPDRSAEMQHFVRSLFWMAREAGAYGLPNEARTLFELARKHSVSQGMDYRLYGTAAMLLGWRRASRLARMVAKWT